MKSIVFFLPTSLSSEIRSTFRTTPMQITEREDKRLQCYLSSTFFTFLTERSPERAPSTATSARTAGLSSATCRHFDSRRLSVPFPQARDRRPTTVSVRQLSVTRARLSKLAGASPIPLLDARRIDMEWWSAPYGRFGLRADEMQSNRTQTMIPRRKSSRSHDVTLTRSSDPAVVKTPSHSSFASTTAKRASNAFVPRPFIDNNYHFHPRVRKGDRSLGVVEEQNVSRRSVFYYSWTVSPMYSCCKRDEYKTRDSMVVTVSRESLNCRPCTRGSVRLCFFFQSILS